MCNFTTWRSVRFFFFINRGAVQRNKCDLCGSTVCAEVYGNFVG